MTRGMNEIVRLGRKLGADKLTFAGLSGVGDLIVTCTSMHSRNRRAGIALGKGKSLDKVLDEIGMVVEGVKTTKAAYKLAVEKNVEMPITAQTYKILFEGENAERGVINLMQRNRKHETENVNFD
jgi:glycerol-3-phosphate dehydrogenase (NAD(P)+)